LTWSLSLSGHKDDATDEDVKMLKKKTDEFVVTVKELGFSATGSLGVSHGAESESIVY
jgi:hypothetical protein